MSTLIKLIFALNVSQVKDMNSDWIIVQIGNNDKGITTSEVAYFETILSCYLPQLAGSFDAYIDIFRAELNLLGCYHTNK
jgi:hypothetical protein